MTLLRISWLTLLGVVSQANNDDRDVVKLTLVSEPWGLETSLECNHDALIFSVLLDFDQSSLHVRLFSKLRQFTNVNAFL